MDLNTWINVVAVILVAATLYYQRRQTLLSERATPRLPSNYGWGARWIGAASLSILVLLAWGPTILTLAGVLPLDAPSLHGHIDGLSYGGELSFDGREPVAPVVLIAEITNTGRSSTIIRNFKLTMDLDGAKYPAQWVAITGKMDLLSDNEKVTIYPDNSLEDRAIIPVPQGGIVTGALVFVFPDIRPTALSPTASLIPHDGLLTHLSATGTSRQCVGQSSREADTQRGD